MTMTLFSTETARGKGPAKDLAIKIFKLYGIYKTTKTHKKINTHIHTYINMYETVHARIEIKKRAEFSTYF